MRQTTYERQDLRDYERRNAPYILAAGHALRYTVQSADHSAERRGNGDTRYESSERMVEGRAMGL
jgi:hypothetical protein